MSLNKYIRKFCRLSIKIVTKLNFSISTLREWNTATIFGSEHLHIDISSPVSWVENYLKVKSKATVHEHGAFLKWSLTSVCQNHFARLSFENTVDDDSHNGKRHICVRRALPTTLLFTINSLSLIYNAFSVHVHVVYDTENVSCTYEFCSSRFFLKSARHLLSPSQIVDRLLPLSFCSLSRVTMGAGLIHLSSCMKLLPGTTFSFLIRKGIQLQYA